jgi:pyruvate,water dikinase
MRATSMIIEAGDRKTIGNKAFDLYRCRLLGVNVPKFYVITSEYNTINTELKIELEKVFVTLGGKVAVRSSSVAEDGYGLSAAGRFKTILNVNSVPELINAVSEVWSSADGADMAVIIQEQLQPAISGVLFTRNPANGKREALIEYVNGLGDKLVSGKVRPVRGNEVNRRREFVNLKRIAAKLEDHFGYPLDIEWAICKNTIFILQARPITAIPPPQLDTARTYSRISAEQFYSGPVSPLFYSFFYLLHSKYYLKETMDDIGWELSIDKSLVRHKSHLYVDTALAEYALKHFPINGGRELFEDLFPEDLKAELADRKSRLDLKAALGLMKYLIRNPGLQPWNLDKHFREEVVPQIYAEIEGLTDFENMDIAELRLAYKCIMATTILHIRYSKWGLALYLPLFMGALARFFKKNGVDSSKISELMTGLPINKTMDASLELQQLARLIKNYPEAVSILHQNLDSYYDCKQKFLKTTSGESIIDYFESILKRYGHRRLSRDLLSPSWNDEPDIPFATLKKIVLDNGTGSGFTKNDPIKKRRDLERNICTQLPFRARFKFKLLSKYFVRYVSFREYQRFYLDMIISKMRVLMLEVARRMVDDGLLHRPEDIFFVELDDILEYFTGKRQSNLSTKAVFNKITFENEVESPGKYLRDGVDFNSITEKKERVIAVGGNVHKGQSISPGFFNGKARVISSIDSNSVISRGDIIVTRSIDPGQTQIFLLAGALILEVGGTLSHGAIIAREFNLPTVADVRNATSIITDGQYVTVDGTKGEIFIE